MRPATNNLAIPSPVPMTW